MNIRDRWIQVKTELASEIRRVNELFTAAKDPTFSGVYIAGQFIADDHLIDKELNIEFFVMYGSGLRVCKNAHWGGNNRKPTHTQECVRSNCPLTLREADQLLSELKALTLEKMHHILDAVLLAVS